MTLRRRTAVSQVAPPAVEATPGAAAAATPPTPAQLPAEAVATTPRAPPPPDLGGSTPVKETPTKVPSNNRKRKCYKELGFVENGTHPHFPTLTLQEGIPNDPQSAEKFREALAKTRAVRMDSDVREEDKTLVYCSLCDIFLTGMTWSCFTSHVSAKSAHAVKAKAAEENRSKAMNHTAKDTTPPDVKGILMHGILRRGLTVLQGYGIYTSLRRVHNDKQRRRTFYDTFWKLCVSISDVHLDHATQLLRAHKGCITLLCDAATERHSGTHIFLASVGYGTTYFHLKPIVNGGEPFNAESCSRAIQECLDQVDLIPSDIRFIIADCAAYQRKSVRNVFEATDETYEVDESAPISSVCLRKIIKEAGDGVVVGKNHVLFCGCIVHTLKNGLLAAARRSAKYKTIYEIARYWSNSFFRNDARRRRYRDFVQGRAAVPTARMRQIALVTQQSHRSFTERQRLLRDLFNEECVDEEEYQQKLKRLQESVRSAVGVGNRPLLNCATRYHTSLHLCFVQLLSLYDEIMEFAKGECDRKRLREEDKESSSIGKLSAAMSLNPAESKSLLASYLEETKPVVSLMDKFGDTARYSNEIALSVHENLDELLHALRRRGTEFSKSLYEQLEWRLQENSALSLWKSITLLDPAHVALLRSPVSVPTASQLTEEWGIEIKDEQWESYLKAAHTLEYNSATDFWDKFAPQFGSLATFAKSAIGLQPSVLSVDSIASSMQWLISNRRGCLTDDHMVLHLHAYMISRSFPEERDSDADTADEDEEESDEELPEPVDRLIHHRLMTRIR